MTTDKTHKGFEEFSIELAKHPEIYTAFGWEDGTDFWEDVSVDLKDLNEGKITSASFSEKHIDLCAEIFIYSEELFTWECSVDRPGGADITIMYELLGFYYVRDDNFGNIGPSKNFNDVIEESVFGALIESKDDESIEQYVANNTNMIQYTEHFERYFDSHIKDIIACLCQNTVGGSINVNGDAYHEINGEIKRGQPSKGHPALDEELVEYINRDWNDGPAIFTIPARALKKKK